MQVGEGKHLSIKEQNSRRILIVTIIIWEFDNHMI